MSMDRLSALALGLVVTLSVSAHNTNITHPLLTLEAIRLIEKSDESGKNYQELYRSIDSDFGGEPYSGITKYPYYWGTWNEFEDNQWPVSPAQRLYERIELADDEEPGTFNPLGLGPLYETIYEANQINVVTGVVREDHPTAKVFNHFYHAYTGDPLTIRVELGDPSRGQALEYLAEATNIYGYEAYPDSTLFNRDEWVNRDTPQNGPPWAKMLSFQSFGEALHHVEDMSSIGHVHNDAHLTLNDSERDDYEGLYVPNVIFQLHNDNSAGNWFTQTRNSTPADVSSIDDIWPLPSTNLDWGATNSSLARKVFNASIFQAKLSRPGSNLFTDNIDREGELKDMFGDRLKLVQTHPRDFPYWRIEGVGNWNYFYPGSSANAWWPIGVFDGPGEDQNGFQYYYLEQKMGDEFNLDDAVRVPNGIRGDLFSPYAGTLDNDKTVLLEEFAKELIPLAIKYSAGFSQYWFDHVNSPPYLKSLAVRQKALGIRLPGSEAASDDYFFTGYQARWQGVVSLLYGHDTQPAWFTSQRILKRERLTQPLYNDQSMDLIMAFSEAIKPPGDGNGNYVPSSGFKLELKILTQDEGSTEESVVRTVELRMENLKYETKTMLEPGGIKLLAPELKYILEDTDKVESHMEGSVWKITVPASELEDISDLQGAVRLVVYAEDRNNHLTKGANDDVRGESLDAKPNTPARVYAELQGDNIAFRWHTGTSFVPSDNFLPEYRNSRDLDGNRLPQDAFAYDYSEGDSSHILWFNGNVENDPNLLESEGSSDVISITSLPERDETLPR